MMLLLSMMKNGPPKTEGPLWCDLLAAHRGCNQGRHRVTLLDLLQRRRVLLRPLHLGFGERGRGLDRLECPSVPLGQLHLRFGERRRGFDLLQRAGEDRSRGGVRSEEHTSELQSRLHLVCRLLLEKKKKLKHPYHAA